MSRVYYFDGQERLAGAPIPDPGPSVTYAVLTNAPAGITLSNGGLTATRAAGGSWVPVLTDIGVGSGKWYWEATIDSHSGTPRFIIGAAESTLPTNNYVGQTSASYGYAQHQFKFNNAVNTAYGATYTTSDIIMVALDLDNGKIWWGKNGSWLDSGDPGGNSNEAYSGLTGTKHGGVGMFPTGALTFNFGASAFTYSVPSGFNSGLYQVT